MENLKKSRSSLRGLFTKSVNKFEEYLKEPRMSKKELNILMANIEQKASQLTKLDQEINVLMLVTDGITEAAFEEEYEACFKYESKLNECRCTVDDIFAVHNQQNASESSFKSAGGNIKKYKLPKIEFTKFSGDIKEWLTWWAQFEKIHDDTELADEDKFHYLRQSTTENSKAREVVDSFPMTGKNYPKVINHLTNRFGNKDTLVEVYVRELLKLVLANALNPSKKVVVSTLYDKLEAQLRALESLNVTRDRFAAILFPLVESCLSEELLRAWERHRIIPVVVDDENVATDRLTNLMAFLRGEVESEERISLARTGFAEQPRKSRKEDKNQDTLTPTAAGLFVRSKNKSECIFCDKPKHPSAICYKAKKLNLDDRNKIIESQQACFICLERGHQARRCQKKSTVSCDICEGNHWSLMCQKRNQTTKIGSTNPTPATSLATISNEVVEKKTNSLMATPACQDDVVLSTMMIRIINGTKKLVVRAAIDSGSHKTYMLKSLIKKLGLLTNGEETLIHELFGGQLTKEIEHKRYKITAENLSGTNSHSFNVLDQDRICMNVPKLRKGPWFEELQKKGIELTDFGIGSSEIELLIGNNVAGQLLSGIYKFTESGAGFGMVAMNYSIGWALMGEVCNNRPQNDATLLVQTLFVQEMDVSNLWRLDVIGIEHAAETKKKEKAIEIAIAKFEETLTVNEEGRYEVTLPFINGHPPMDSNRILAEKRLSTMTKKLSPELKQIYQQIFEKWEADGIIETVPEDEETDYAHYLPHKAVLKPSSLTTPVRPVFDASAKEKNSMSLNDCLEKGPNLLEITTSVLSRFRLRPIGVLSDIEKAFLQISIQPKHRDNLRFLWWEKNDSQKVKIYRHRRLVFGLTCSSFILASTINHILEKVPPEYEKTAKQLKNANYVDNCVTSLENEEAVIRFKDEATTIMATGKLNLRDWMWNSPSNVQDKEVSVLGLMWNLKDDTLCCEIIKNDVIGDGPVTKRKLLSIVHQIFDPIGFTIPLLICPKLYVQESWELKVGWDDELPDEICKKFRKWFNQISEVKQIEIPRWIGFSNENSHLTTLHIFSDASKLAYAAGAFLRIESEKGVSTRLVQARSRVAPLAKLSSQRLELLGCLIGSRLSLTIKNDLGLENVKCYYWTDSADSLYWIKNEDQWGTYVWNRVSEIRKSSDINAWRHVPGKLNPADLPSRGCNAKQLVESSWWEGPNWLKLPESQWPSENIAPDDEVLKTERKRTVISAWELVRQKTNTTRITRYTGDYDKMIRYVALMIRIFENIKKLKKNRVTGELTFDELENGERKILVLVQNEAFTGREIILENMDLFVDDHQILRVKTKVFLRDDKESFRTPAILPGKHPITKALIEYYHRKSSHAGTQTLMTILREKFWIVKSRVAIKNVVKECMVCKRFSAKPFGTKPTYLPLNRVKDSTVFEITGVDLAGHLFLNNGQKVWIALFTCAVYRAIHLELVTSTSTECFIQALRRFVSRRGRPRTMYSDPGKNFVGTDNALKKMDWNKIKEVVYPEKIEWTLNPPKSPWWGGWWERLIGMVKDLLRKVLGKACIDYEEMLTVLCDCESVINSRPLTYISEDPTDLATLTPDMFLKEAVKPGVIELDHIDSKYLNSKRGERQQIMEELRQRFRIEYLAQLPTRKGDKETRRIEIGEIVLLADENTKKINWPLARVVEIYPGKENKVRVAKVRTKNGELVRPVKKLIPLEIRPDEQSSTGITSAKESSQLNWETGRTGKKSNKESKTKSNKENETKLDEETETKSSEEADVEPMQVRTRSGRLVKRVNRLGQNQ